MGPVDKQQEVVSADSMSCCTCGNKQVQPYFFEATFANDYIYDKMNYQI